MRRATGDALMRPFSPSAGSARGGLLALGASGSLGRSRSGAARPRPSRWRSRPRRRSSSPPSSVSLLGRRGAVADSPPSPIRAIVSPTGSVSPSWATISQRAVLVGLVRHVGLVGLDLDQLVPAGDLVAVGLEPLEDRALLHRVGQAGHRDVGHAPEVYRSGRGGNLQAALGRTGGSSRSCAASRSSSRRMSRHAPSATMRPRGRIDRTLAQLGGERQVVGDDEHRLVEPRRASRAARAARAGRGSPTARRARAAAGPSRGRSRSPPAGAGPSESWCGARSAACSIRTVASAARRRARASASAERRGSAARTRRPRARSA